MNQSGNPGGGPYRLDIDAVLPLTSLIESRLRMLDLSVAGLARRMGYETTVEKGVRRIEALLAGDLEQARKLTSGLATGLEVDKDVVQAAIEDTRYVHWARDDRAYRQAFQPHVVWETTLSVPSPIAVAGMVNARRRLFWYPGAIEAARISDEAVAAMPEGVACYGRVIGFHVNYSPDCAVRFNRQGESSGALDQAIRPGTSHASVKGRPLELASDK